VISQRLSLCFVTFLSVAAAQSPARAPKVALVNIQDAIVATTDGQRANQQLEAEFAPKKAKLEDEQKALIVLQDKLQQESLTDEDRKKLSKEIDEKTILLNVETDQDDADLSAAQKRMLADLGKKMVAVIADYAARNGYAMVFDISTSQAPLLYADNATDITKDVVGAYETKYRK
jgi:Skp family chaperone for outer membrane proteins